MEMGTEVVLDRMIWRLKDVLKEDSENGEDFSKAAEVLLISIKEFIYNIPTYEYLLHDLKNAEKKFNKDFKINWSNTITVRY